MTDVMKGVDIVKKIMCTCLASVLLIGLSLSVSASSVELLMDVNIEAPYGGDLVYSTPISATNSSVLFTEPEEEDSVLPSAVDNSNTMYFPVIGDQGNLNSCTAWSTVYYMYTYHVNRLHQTSATITDENNNTYNDPTKVYSPSWAYSLMTVGNGKGVERDSLINFTKDHGQLTLADSPLFSDENPYPSYVTDETALIKALSTRISASSTLEVATSEESPITSKDSEKLTTIKQFLNNGYILGVSVCADGTNFTTKIASNGEKCVYRVGYSYNGHAMTIVGYDDTLWCDINENGTPEDAEYGAFKVANSEGSEWENAGFIWVAYDALNVVSAVENMDETVFTTARVRAFCRKSIGLLDTDNLFTYIQVQDYEVDYACVSTIHVARSNGIDVWMDRVNENGVIVSQNYSLHYLPSYPLMDYKLAFDCSELSTPISDYLTGHTWEFWVEGTAGAYDITDNYIVDCKIMDNFGNVISNGSYFNETTKWVHDIDLAQGDMDYSGEVNMRDAMALYQYTSGNVTELSNVQMSLGDMNADGVVNVRDSALLYQQVKVSSSAMVISDEYAEFISIMENILIELGMQ